MKRRYAPPAAGRWPRGMWQRADVVAPLWAERAVDRRRLGAAPSIYTRPPAGPVRRAPLPRGIAVALEKCGANNRSRNIPF